ncbi:unnamed protein product [Candidula unifasciata]|uniref:Ribosome biogenesis regulatory protein n=1 Tax=Candidula unifasciata TaxID=100452 RepID=A0A8S3YJ43_9EUPU|nr:unnamed protein product [Candidula unifasciata]
MADTQIVVDKVLQKDVNKVFSTAVENAELIDIDEGLLLATTTGNLNIRATHDFTRQNGEEVIRQSTRSAVQTLFNSLWQLPVEQVEGTYVVTLPEIKMWLPREKPIPKKRAVTKWQEYAKSKGILNKKKSRMVWDEAAKEYKPRWGYKRANDGTQDWLIEVPANADPMEDQFAKRQTAKKERVAKNELQRLRNIARSQKRKVPGVGLTPTEQPSKDTLSKALVVARKSTASLGKFTEKLPKEKPSKFTGKKRKFEPSIGDLKNERERQLKILDVNAKKVPTINVTKATNRALRESEEQRSRERPSRKTPKKQKGKGASAGRKGGGNKKNRVKRNK